MQQGDHSGTAQSGSNIPESNQQTVTGFRSSQRQDLTPLEAFFAEYPSFEYRTSSPVASEFYRLCRKFKWQKGDPPREEAFENYKRALSIQFNETYGTDRESLGEWQNLCKVIGIHPIPTNVNACREAVRNAHVNLVDLVDPANTGKEVRTFPTEQALSEYTKSTGKFFPRDDAYAGGLLRYLLRRIMDPRRGEADI